MGIHYDHWRTTPLEGRIPDPLPPMTLRTTGAIEAGDVQIDPWLFYDEAGELQSVQINGRQIKPEAVMQALALLGIEDWPWHDDLDEDRLADLVEEELKSRAEDRADWLRGMREERQ